MILLPRISERFSKPPDGTGDYLTNKQAAALDTITSHTKQNLTPRLVGRGGADSAIVSIVLRLDRRLLWGDLGR